MRKIIALAGTIRNLCEVYLSLSKSWSILWITVAIAPSLRNVEYGDMKMPTLWINIIGLKTNYFQATLHEEWNFNCYWDDLLMIRLPDGNPTRLNHALSGSHDSINKKYLFIFLHFMTFHGSIKLNVFLNSGYIRHVLRLIWYFTQWFTSREIRREFHIIIKLLWTWSLTHWRLLRIPLSLQIVRIVFIIKISQGNYFSKWLLGHFGLWGGLAWKNRPSNIGRDQFNECNMCTLFKHYICGNAYIL